MRKFNDFLNEKRMSLNIRGHWNSEYGYENVKFQKGGFQKFLIDMGIDPNKWILDKTGFLWQNDNFAIYTLNNPITGEWKTDFVHPPELDYAGNMGIFGTTEQTEKARILIKKYADSIKKVSTTSKFI